MNTKLKGQGMMNLEHMTERELLIQQATHIDTLCSTVKSLKRENSDDHGTLFQLMGDLGNDKVAIKLFFWVLSAVFLCMIGLFSYVDKIDNKVIQIETTMAGIKLDHNRGVMYPIKVTQ